MTFGKEFKFEELMNRSIPELEEIKKAKQKQLYLIQKDKAVLCANIVSLQNMIESECEKYVEIEKREKSVSKIIDGY